VIERGTALSWRFLEGAWERGVCRACEVRIDGHKVLGAQQPAIPTPSGGATVDVEGRATLVAVLEALRQHGLIAR
jgi:hypothetical protein